MLLKNFSLFLFFYLIFTNFLSFIYTTEYQDPKISYEIHSSNDLRQWNSIFNKIQNRKNEEHWIKIDLFYIPKNNYNNFPQCNQTEENGCLLLTHNFPIKGVDYNTTEHLLNYISDKNNQEKFRNSQEKIVIVLSNDLINSQNLNLEFILDGASTPGGALFDFSGERTRKCLAEKWSLWNSTFISIQDPIEIAFSDENYFSRFQILNEFITPFHSTFFIDYFKKFDWGKFQQTNYPFLFWEPSDQEIIQSVEKSYLSGKKHNPGIRISINIDPIQFEVFSANYTGIAWNRFVSPDSIDPHIIPINYNFTKNDVPQEISFMVLSKNANQTLQFNSFSSPNFFNNEINLISTGEIQNYTQKMDHVSWISLKRPSSSFFSLNQQETVFSKYFSKDSSQILVLISSFDGKNQPFHFNTDDFSFFQINQSNLNFIGSTKISVVHALDSHILQFYIPEDDESTLLFQLSDLYFHWDSKMHLIINNTKHTPKVALIDLPLNIQHISVSAIYDLSNHSLIHFFLTFSTIDSHLFAVVGTISTKTASITNSSSLIPRFIGFAKSSQISLLYLNQSLYCLMLNSQGVCYQNEKKMKNGKIKICDQKGELGTNALNYAIAPFQNWQIFLKQSDQILNVCSEQILVGTYDIGKNSHGFFTSSKKDDLIVLEVHEGISKDEICQNCEGCGEPYFLKGIILDSWKFSFKF
ncbi:hypothetical protein M0811_07198 [Anaeramoeba ignava]|uniref:Uncharacterized protein n=1 Tax=Anaeramoeba ignava TaxID=1746090 RepID=A0A9Q0RDI5_ANAIG|nr:hypothetical protein M0811_07198 [Anaeramoeba ignava]